MLKVVISGEEPSGVWAVPVFFMGPRQSLPSTETP